MRIAGFGGKKPLIMKKSEKPIGTYIAASQCIYGIKPATKSK